MDKLRRSTYDSEKLRTQKIGNLWLLMSEPELTPTVEEDMLKSRNSLGLLISFI